MIEYIALRSRCDKKRGTFRVNVILQCEFHAWTLTAELLANVQRD